MLQTVITAVLAPALILQGRRVRRNALELPEASGRREGATGNGPSFRLLVLGDSAAAGVGVPTQEQALMGRLVQALGQNHTVHWRLVARSGHCLADVVRAAQGLPQEPVDLVVVSAGINDVLRGTRPVRWVQGLHSLAVALQERCSPRAVAFSGIPRIQNFPLLPQPLAWYLGRRARQFNGSTRLAIPSLPESWRVVDLDLPLTADFLARDGFHPNEAACALWCRQVLAVAVPPQARSGGAP